MAIYYQRLSKYDVAQLVAAADSCIDRCKFFPTVAEIIDAISPIPKPAQKLLGEPHDPKVTKMLHELADRLNTRGIGR